MADADAMDAISIELNPDLDPGEEVALLSVESDGADWRNLWHGLGYGFPGALPQFATLRIKGNGPDRLFTLTVDSDAALDKPEGICPEKLLLSSKRTVRFFKSTMSSGISPDREFEERFNTSRERNLPKPEGMAPVRLLPDKEMCFKYFNR
jgi:hypothetical protein